MFSTSDYLRLHELVFRSDFGGYKPSVTEIPNGDGKADVAKRYAHIALKYLTDEIGLRSNLMPYLEAAHGEAVQVARRLALPVGFMPKLEYGALRVLEYKPGATSNRHEDFDLFTLMLYRDQPDRFVSYEDEYRPGQSLAIMRDLNAQAHLGQLGEAIGLGPATPHEVLPSERVQRSIVYFAIPDHGAVLPGGVKVRDWLNERMARSRTSFKAYE